VRDLVLTIENFKRHFDIGGARQIGFAPILICEPSDKIEAPKGDLSAYESLEPIREQP
jgi:hypothetical protein